MSLPHIRNSQAGVNKYDPVHSSIFEVQFTLPEPLRKDFGRDEAILSEHVLKVSGLEKLHAAPDTGTQKFMGTDRSFINPAMDSTRAEIQIDFSLNLRNKVDNYIYKLLRAWARLGYNISTGERHLKTDYCSDWMRISVANREGDIFHDILFKDMMMNGGLEGYNELDYSSNDPVQISAKFVSDWWDDLTA